MLKWNENNVRIYIFLKLSNPQIRINFLDLGVKYDLGSSQLTLLPINKVDLSSEIYSNVYLNVHVHPSTDCIYYCINMVLLQSRLYIL